MLLPLWEARYNCALAWLFHACAHSLCHLLDFQFADYEILAKPVGGRIFFAGEHTHGDFSGTMHGAYLSGVREGERIKGLYRAQAIPKL
jgi:hypothetical protein